MVDIILQHGAWHGSWVWDRVAPLLRAQGHTVHTPTLVGMGETAGIYNHHPYSHLGIRDHIEQIERYITLNDLQAPFLVGHSYGGIVTNGVLNRLGDQLAGALFLDAIFFVPGRRFAELVQISDPPAWLRPWYRTVLRNVLLNRPVPPPPVEFMGLDDPADAEYVAQRMTVLPSRMASQCDPDDRVLCTI